MQMNVKLQSIVQKKNVDLVDFWLSHERIRSFFILFYFILVDWKIKSWNKIVGYAIIKEIIFTHAYINFERAI